MSNISGLYYDFARPSAFSTLRKLRLATAGMKGKPPPPSADVIKAWLEKQDVYTLHRPVRKRFTSNPYAVSNVMFVWEYDLIDMQAYAKYNHNYRYIPSVIDVFSKYLHLVPIRTKSGPSVASAFRSIFDERHVAQYGCALIRARKF